VNPAARARFGVACAILACAAWGFAFVGPLILGAWPASTVAAGRYIAYGLWSLLALIVMRARGTAQPMTFKTWGAALPLTLGGNLLYYVLMSIALQRAGALITTLIIGLLPVTVSITGRLRARQPLTRHYAVALVLIGAGLWLADRPPPGSHTGTDTLGLGCVVAALALWTVYAHLNSDWLRAHPRMGGVQWSSMQGAGALPFALALFGAAPHAPAGQGWAALIAVSITLGVITSWAANTAWNLASTRVDTSLLGQLFVFETVAGIAYAALWSRTLPSLGALAGAALLIGGVVIAMRERAPAALPNAV
jgi:drug/metabolite transporter (DMT)-like permease